MRILPKLLPVCLLSASLSPAGAEGYSRADLPQYTQSMHRYLLDWAVSGQLRQSTETQTGHTNQYLQYGPNKAIAICIDWEKSTPRAPAPVAIGQSWEQRSVAQARENAMFYCERFRRGRACDCVMVDVNEKSVFALPPAFVARFFR